MKTKYLFLIALVILLSCDSHSEYETSFSHLDFSNANENLIYNFYQEANQESKFGKALPNDSPDKIKLSSRGKFVIKTKAKNLADFAITDYKIDVYKLNEKDLPMDTIQDNLPPIIIQDISEKVSIGDAKYAYFNFLFLLPNETLRLGETQTLDYQIPFNINNSKIFIKGKVKIAYDDILEIENVKFAKVNCDIQLSNLQIPKEIKGTYRCSFVGNASYLFDLKNKRMKKSEATLQVKIYGKMLDNETQSDLEISSSGNQMISIDFSHSEKENQ